MVGGAAAGLRTRLAIANGLLRWGHGAGQSSQQCKGSLVFRGVFPTHNRVEKRGSAVTFPMDGPREEFGSSGSRVSPSLLPTLPGAGRAVPVFGLWSELCRDLPSGETLMIFQDKLRLLGPLTHQGVQSFFSLTR